MKRWIPFLKPSPSVAVVRLQGIIASGARGGLNDRTLAPVLERAFSRGKPDAVAIQINSPGGSPVQSSLIGARIRRLAEEKNIPVIAFVEDVAASGGYWLAAAADEIYADHASVLGSIGVISAGFGAHNFIEKHGIERRVYTAGQSKSMNDPFRAENPQDVARLKTLLEGIHLTFQDHVKTRRADKLDTKADLFNGEIWLAQQALELGLIDGIGHMKPTLKARFGDKLRIRRYEIKRSMFTRIGAHWANDAITSIEERAAYARFGL